MKVAGRKNWKAAGCIPKKKGGAGGIPAAAAAPTDPSFRDNSLKKQCRRFSRKIFEKFGKRPWVTVILTDLQKNPAIPSEKRRSPSKELSLSFEPDHSERAIDDRSGFTDSQN